MREYLYQRLGTDIRSWLVQSSIQRTKLGQDVLYLAPSREVFFAVRRQIEAEQGGLMHIQVGGFEDLERRLLQDDLVSRQRIDRWAAERMIGWILNQKMQDNSLLPFSASFAKEGFSQLIYRQIKRMKRDNIDPESLQAKLASPGWNEDQKESWEMLRTVYAAYQQLLAEKMVMDVDDLSLAAAGVQTVASEGLPDLLILDGFMNIDPVQRAMLANLQAIKPDLDCLAGIPFYTESADRFVSREIIRDLESLGWSLHEPAILLPKVTLAAADLAQNLFDLDAPDTAYDKNPQFVDAPCLEDEVRQILHKVRDLLADAHTHPEQIALVIREMDLYQDVLVEIAEELGVPLDMREMRPLGSSFVVKDILRALETAETSFFQVKGKDSSPSNLFGDDDGEIWLEAFWPESAPADDFGRRLLDRLDTMDLRKKLCVMQQEGQIGEEWLFRELVALQVFAHTLESLIAAHRFLPQVQDISAQDFQRLLVKEIDQRSVPGVRPLSGVKVLDPDLLRAVSYEHVFCLGLNDGAFPRTGGTDFFASTEGGIDGIPVRGPSWELEREKIRFLLVCAAAQKSLTLSYRTANEDGSFLLPSPFLQDAANYLGWELQSTRTMRDRFIPRIEEVYSLKEAIRVWALSRDMLPESKNSAFWQKLFSDPQSEQQIRQVMAAFQVETERSGHGPCGCYDGNLQGSVLVQQQQDYPFSASQLNEYRRCPFRYFAGRILGLQSAEEDEEINPLFLGSLYHSVLAEYYRTHSDQMEVNRAGLDECLQEKIAELNKFQYNAMFLQAKEKEIRENLKTFLEYDLTYRQQFAEIQGTHLIPTYLEWPLDDAVTIPGCRFRASIDRVDLEMQSGHPTGRYVVYDYKTKNIQNTADILKGDDLQLAVYALLANTAVKAALQRSDAECLGVVFYSITKREKKGLHRDDWRKALGIRSRGIHAQKWQPLLEALKDRILRQVEQIRSGRFTLPVHCPHAGTFVPYSCDFEPMCRYDPERMAYKGGRRDDAALR